MSPERSEKVRKARDQARRALGRSEDQLDHYDRAGPPGSQRVEPSRIKFMPAGESVPVLTFADVARSLGITQARVAAMVHARELPTLTVGDFDAQMVTRADVERLRAQRDADQPELYRLLVAMVRTAVNEIEALILSDAWDALPRDRQRALADTAQEMRKGVAAIEGAMGEPFSAED